MSHLKKIPDRIVDDDLSVEKLAGVCLQKDDFGCLVPPEIIPEEIAKYRKKIGMTQKDFSEQFGVPLGTLRRWEQGQNTPLFSNNLRKIFNKLLSHSSSSLLKDKEVA